MDGHGAANPALVVAIALAAGIMSQSLARHLRIPGIVILLAVGVLLGPDGIGIVRPGDLAGGLHVLVQFAVAVILFEGGLSLQWRRLRHEANTIRRLVTAGAIVTWGGAALAAHWVIGWGWTSSILFGSLVIVTGPTVITPLLRRIRVRRNLETILEAEGIFIDAVGAIIAVVTLEVALSTSGSEFAQGIMSLPVRLGVGAAVGVASGFTIMFLLRWRAVGEGLENVFTLALAIATFQFSNALSDESGIVAVIAAGLVLANSHIDVKQDLKEFKEQLTVLLIGMLFVLLAADVRMTDVTELGIGGVLVVAALMFVVRPLSVIACTIRGDLKIRERVFLAWLAPRGIVAAAVASLFYERMSAHGIEGGAQMRALVFLVIAITVVFQGGTGSLMARWLGVRRPSDQGYVFLGANDLSLCVAEVMREGGEEVVLIDANPTASHIAEQRGFRVLHGSGLDERVMVSAGLDTRRGAIALLTNPGINVIFAEKARSEYRVPRAYVAAGREPGVSEEVVRGAGATILFGEHADTEIWNVRVRRNIALTKPMRYSPAEVADGSPLETPPEMKNVILPLVHQIGDALYPVDERTTIKKDDVVHWMVFSEREDDAMGFLRGRGWREAAAPEAGAAGEPPADQSDPKNHSPV